MKKIALFYLVMALTLNCGGGAPSGAGNEALQREVAEVRGELAKQASAKLDLERQLSDERQAREKATSDLSERERLREEFERKHLSSAGEALNLKQQVRSLSEPLEVFKRASQEFISNLGPRALFGTRKEEQFQTFKQKLAFLADRQRLVEKPMLATKPLSLPLPLVFDVAPKAPVEFDVLIAFAHGEFAEEQRAKFILATDDPQLINAVEAYKFRVPVGFPTLYLGNGVFMLPKMLLDPLYEEQDSNTLIPLDYDFETNDGDPDGYETYTRNLLAREAKLEKAKSLAAELRQRKLDEKLRVPTSP